MRKIISVVFSSFVIAFVSCSGGETDSSISGMAVTAQAFELHGEQSVDNFKLHWNPVAGAAFYSMRGRPRGGSWETIIDAENKKLTTTWDVYDQENVTWTYQVSAHDESGKIIASDSVVCVPFTEESDLNVYDNTKKTSFINTDGFYVGNKWYRWVYHNVAGVVTLTEQTSDDGYVWNVDDEQIIITGDSSYSGKPQYNSALNDCKFESSNFAYHNGEIIMWNHYENSKDYSLGQVYCVHGVPGSGVAYGDESGINPPSAAGSGTTTCRDLNFFVDTDNKAYLFGATETNNNITMYPLKDNWTEIDYEKKPMLMCKNAKREAPCMIKEGGWYYFFSSGAAGWYPTVSKYVSASSLANLEDLNQQVVGDSSTFGTQSGGVVKIGDNYIMFGNRWTGGWSCKDPEYDNGHGQRIFPISMKNGYAFFDFYHYIKYDAARGIIIPVQDGYKLSQYATVRPGNSTSSADGDFDINYALDGISYDTSKFYRPKTTAFDLVLDFGMGKKAAVNEADISFYSLNGSESYTNYTIDISDDCSTWTKIVDENNKGNNFCGFRTNIVDEGNRIHKGRFIRLHGISTHYASQQYQKAMDVWGLGIHEFMVYGKYE